MEKQLQAAVGYLELGMLGEANDEIENLAPELKTSSPVLGVRLEIYRAAEKWSLMEVVARELWKRHPDEPVYWNDLAWAVRRAASINAAHSILLDAVERFPGDAMTHFNLVEVDKHIWRIRFYTGGGREKRCDFFSNYCYCLIGYH